MPAQLSAEGPRAAEAPPAVNPAVETRTPQASKQALEIATEIGREMTHPDPNPDLTLQKILESSEQKPVTAEVAKPAERIDTLTLQKAEQAFIGRKTTEDPKKFGGLEDRYKDKGSDSRAVTDAVDSHAKKAGLEHVQSAELAGKAFNPETRKQIGELVQAHIDRLFNSEQGRKNPDKQKSVTWETQRYLDLMAQAQGEGDVSSSLDAQVVLSLVERNVWQLAYQDRVASENLMGDHGVRHLVDHNIKVTESIADALESQGQRVKAVDRLIMHQTMLDHDLGYATGTVRDGYADSTGAHVKGINEGGFGVDTGHNILSAKVVSQRLEDPSDPLATVFSEKQLQTLHEAILYHDDSKVDFRVGDESEEARKTNIESAVHVADNTHAFEDKLPELLYGYPDTLKTMRLLKTAGEIGDPTLADQLKVRLVENINNTASLSLDDKEALTMAAGSLKPDSYKFSVGRICGNKPEFDLDPTGKLTIRVAESEIHQEAVGLFGQESYDQLQKFVADLTGKKKGEVDMNQERVTTANGKMEIRLKTGAAKSTEQTDYQRQVESLIKDPAFQEFILGGTESGVGDAQLSRNQLSLEADLKKMEPDTDSYTSVSSRITQIKQNRAQNLADYMRGK